MLIVVAPAFTIASTVRQRYSKSVASVLGRELDVPAEGACVLHRVDAPLQDLLPVGAELLLDMDVRGARTCGSGRFATFTRPTACRCPSSPPARAGDDRPLDGFRDRWTDSKSPARRPEPRLDDVHVQHASCRAISTFWSFASFARDLLPVPQRRVEDENLVAITPSLRFFNQSSPKIKPRWLVPGLERKTAEPAGPRPESTYMVRYALRLRSGPRGGVERARATRLPADLRSRSSWFDKDTGASIRLSSPPALSAAPAARRSPDTSRRTACSIDRSSRTAFSSGMKSTSPR